jgi:hypothetical protein
MSHDSLEEIPDEEWEYTFATNISAMFYLVKAALPHMGPGSSIIGSSSVNSDMPSPTLAPYAATKAAIANFAASLAGMLGDRGIRVNSVAPGPIWTPLIPATMPEEKVKNFGKDTPLGRAGQPAELAPVYVLLASDEGGYISAARIAVTGGRPILSTALLTEASKGAAAHPVAARFKAGPWVQISATRASRRAGGFGRARGGNITPCLADEESRTAPERHPMHTRNRRSPCPDVPLGPKAPAT